MNKTALPTWVSEHDHIVLFDGVCHLCSGWVHFLIQRDPGARFSFCSVQSSEGKALLQSVGLDSDDIETMVYVREGQVFLRSTALLEIVKELPAAWPVLAGGLYVPKGFRDAFYTLIARNRYRIAGKKTHCLMPSDDVKARFIEWNITCR